MRVITGTARGAKLIAPKGMQTRPTADRVKEGLFSAIQFEIEGRRVLDLFAGSGQLGIEALSRGAEYAVFVDRSADAIAAIRVNLEKTHLSDRSRVVRGDYQSFLSQTKERYDIIFLDPPYAENFQEKALKCISEIDILRQGGIIICEKPREKEIPDDLPGLIMQKEYRYGKVTLWLYRKV
ncbi:MAG: 16S rRNA (guanine(966)-N(2))-methyltransferase RsmD [Oscillospiraceae bacterium]|nr:16S rRNA (guanine(966)-N(2))-methyltransferase RsmD [Oscillospiraceae bacterium]